MRARTATSKSRRSLPRIVGHWARVARLFATDRGAPYHQDALGAAQVAPDGLGLQHLHARLGINFNSDFGLIWLFPKEAIAKKWDPLTMESL
jgi:hypothetical protein